jgi:hypothetical protein
MNAEKAIEWCTQNPDKIMESENGQYIMFYDSSDDINTKRICECGYMELCESIGIVIYDNKYSLLGKPVECFNISFYIVQELKNNKFNTINFERYKWVKHRGYRTLKERNEHVYTLTTDTPYQGYMYIDEEPICPVWFKEDDNSMELNDYGESILKNKNILGKTITIKNIHDIITGYKCRWGEIIGDDNWVHDVGEVQGGSCCAVCGKCTKPYKTDISL